MIQYLEIEFLRMISHLTLSQGMKEFLLKLPVGFWTLMSGVLTACVALATLIVTQVMNKKTQATQLKHQEQMTATQLIHQKEMAYIQYFLDKRTSAVLDFQKTLEETKAGLVYFLSEPADLERRRALDIQYINDETPRWKGIIRPGVYSWNDCENLKEVALNQIKPVEEKIIELKTSLNILIIYLNDDEAGVVEYLLDRIDYLQYFIVGNLKGIKTRDDDNIYMFVHANEPMVVTMQEINMLHKEVRHILKNYLYIHKLEA
ncbi:hypothetical protein NQ109_28470 [Priestia megaterium]|uniref:hypothetical protein n=1 Tax=Priestia megaterium TaxID=1404 RepID=UPI00215B6209|nr:hypothetical protein [Priestia megaterium]MCR8866864.1 hypothetical protein [Priestia megaterium]